MHKDLVHSTPYLQQMRVAAAGSGVASGASYPLRNALGRRLIALGQWLVDSTAEREPLNTPA